MLTFLAISSASADYHNWRSDPYEMNPKASKCEDLFKGSSIKTQLLQVNDKTTPSKALQAQELQTRPLVYRDEGIKQYVGSTQNTLPPNRLFSYTIFYSKDLLKTLDEISHVKNTFNPIRPPWDGEFIGKIDFWSSTSCKKVPKGRGGTTGGALATRLWKSKDKSVTSQDIVDEFRKGFRPVITQQQGFQMYTGVVVDKETAFFMNAFDSEEEAAVANAAAANFIADGPLAGRIALVLSNTDSITFDYFMANGNKGKGKHQPSHNQYSLNSKNNQHHKDPYAGYDQDSSYHQHYQNLDYYLQQQHHNGQYQSNKKMNYQ